MAELPDIFADQRLELESIAMIRDLKIAESPAGIALQDPRSPAAIIIQSARRNVFGVTVRTETHSGANPNFFVLFDREKWLTTGVPPTITEEIDPIYETAPNDTTRIGNRIVAALEKEVARAARTREGLGEAHERILEVLPTLVTVVRSKETQIPRATVFVRPDTAPVIHMETAGTPNVTVSDVAIDTSVDGKITFSYYGRQSLTITTRQGKITSIPSDAEAFLRAYDPTLNSQAYGRSDVIIPPRRFMSVRLEMRRFIELAVFALQDRIEADKNQRIPTHPDVLAARNALLRVR